MINIKLFGRALSKFDNKWGGCYTDKQDRMWFWGLSPIPEQPEDVSHLGGRISGPWSKGR